VIKLEINPVHQLFHQEDAPAMIGQEVLGRLLDWQFCLDRIPGLNLSPR